MCLDHVREHNDRYNYFDGMSVDEIAEAQTPLGGWDRPTRSFATGGDPPPAWRDFSDPLDAIAARFARASSARESRFSKAERRALAVLGLAEDCDRAALRKRYGQLLRKYHPDQKGGDRSREHRLSEVIAAYQCLKASKALNRD